MDKKHSPNVCFGTVGFQLAVVLGFLWATSSDDIASHKLEWVLGAYSENFPLQWDVGDGYDAEDAARSLSATADTWTDGSMVEVDVSLVCPAGAGCIPNTLILFWARRSCGHLDDVGTQKCWLFCAVPGPLQTVQ